MAIDGHRSDFTADKQYIIDSFTQMSELLESDVENVQRWKTLKAKQNKSEAELNELATLTTLLSGKLVTAYDWNKLCDCMVNLEKLYVDKGLDEIDSTVENYVANYTQTNAQQAIKEIINTTIDDAYQIDAVKIIINTNTPEVVNGAIWFKPKTN